MAIPETIADTSPHLGEVVVSPRRTTGTRRRGLGWQGLVLPVATAVLWEVGARVGFVSTRLLPSPSQIFDTVSKLAASGELADHTVATLWRVFWGFFLGASVATVLGAASGVSRKFRAFVDPTFQALRSIPSIAWTPLFILWFGIFETPKVLLIAVGVFFPVYLALVEGIGSVDRKLVEVGRTYGFGTLTLTRRILLPAALPTYLVGLRGGLGLGWMFVVAAEFLGATRGLGYLLVDGQMTGRPAVIIASIVLFALLGKATDWGLARVGARLVRWQDDFQSRAR
ncbi:MAG TPA: ABC transporter permease [Acidimicrobiia bacterium]|jgi:sulfonate transport system permease protein